MLPPKPRRPLARYPLTATLRPKHQTWGAHRRTVQRRRQTELAASSTPSAQAVYLSGYHLRVPRQGSKKGPITQGYKYRARHTSRCPRGRAKAHVCGTRSLAMRHCCLRDGGKAPVVLLAAAAPLHDKRRGGRVRACRRLAGLTCKRSRRMVGYRMARDRDTQHRVQIEPFLAFPQSLLDTAKMTRPRGFFLSAVSVRAIGYLILEFLAF